jgi:hypothetical protein
MESSFLSLIPFLPLFCSCQFRRLDLVQFQAHIPAGSHPETQLVTSLCAPEHFFITTLHGPRRTHNLYSGGVFTDPLPSSGCPVVAHVGFLGMFLPSRCLAMGLYVTVLRSSRICVTTSNKIDNFINCTEKSERIWRSYLHVRACLWRSHTVVGSCMKGEQLCVSLVATIIPLTIPYQCTYKLKCPIVTLYWKGGSVIFWTHLRFKQ